MQQCGIYPSGILDFDTAAISNFAAVNHS